MTISPLPQRGFLFFFVESIPPLPRRGFFIFLRLSIPPLPRRAFYFSLLNQSPLENHHLRIAILPAQAGIQKSYILHWAPACAGVMVLPAQAGIQKSHIFRSLEITLQSSGKSSSSWQNLGIKFLNKFFCSHLTIPLCH